MGLEETPGFLYDACPVPLWLNKFARCHPEKQPFPINGS
jgi:hypothetical protein